VRPAGVSLKAARQNPATALAEAAVAVLRLRYRGSDLCHAGVQLCARSVLPAYGKIS
jgi:hypothetical protein